MSCYCLYELPHYPAQPFACEPLQESDSPKVSTVTSLGNANKCFDQMIFKIFNNKINPGYLLHGICYFEVCEDVKINNIVLNGISTVNKDISGKYKSNTDAVRSYIKQKYRSTRDRIQQISFAEYLV